MTTVTPLESDLTSFQTSAIHIIIFLFKWSKAVLLPGEGLTLHPALLTGVFWILASAVCLLIIVALFVFIPVLFVD